MTPSGIEPATFRFVAQYLNHCATAGSVNVREEIAVYCAGHTVNRERERALSLCGKI
jgi:hypothetical protein